MLGKRKRMGAGMLVGLVLMSLVAAGGPAAASRATGADQPTTTFVGAVKGLDAFLAVVVDEDGAIAYLCDGADVTDWFRGTNDDGALDLGNSGGATLAAGVGKKKLDGIITLPDGTTADFALKQATKQAGLFRVEQLVEGTGFAAGWVVLPDGSAYGKVETANIANAPVLPPPPPVDRTVPTTVATTPPKTVGTVAPAQIAAQFPADPPPDSEVTVVPFTTGAQTDQGSDGGGNVDPAEPGDALDAPPKDVVPVACTDPKEVRNEIAALQSALSETVGLLKRRAIKQQIERLQQILEEANRAGGQLNCTLPLK